MSVGIFYVWLMISVISAIISLVHLLVDFGLAALWLEITFFSAGSCLFFSWSAYSFGMHARRDIVEKIERGFAGHHEKRSSESALKMMLGELFVTDYTSVGCYQWKGEVFYLRMVDGMWYIEFVSNHRYRVGQVFVMLWRKVKNLSGTERGVTPNVIPLKIGSSAESVSRGNSRFFSG